MTDCTDWKPVCKHGQPCGYSCISSAFRCESSLSDSAQLLLGNLVALGGALSSHSGALFSHTDASGRTWFCKRFSSIESSSVQKEHDAYIAAAKLGMERMLVKPKFIDLGKGAVMAVWPMLEGEPLRSKVARDGRKSLSELQMQQLAIARQFDDAIRNPDRNMGNVWVMPDGRLRLIDHDAAFSAAYSREAAHASSMSFDEAKRIHMLET
jgi:hypothetical protein